MPARPVVRRLEWIDPEALFLGGPARAAHAFWLDAGPDATAGWSWLGVGERASSWPRELVVGAEPGRAVGGSAGVPGGFAGGWVGWLSYDGGARRAGAPSTVPDGETDEVAVVAHRLVAFDHAARECWLIAPAGDHDGEDGALAEVLRWRARASDGATARRADEEGTDADGEPGTASVAHARHTPVEYAQLIARCREAIREGNAYQLCLTTRFSLEASDAPLDPVAAYLRLRHAQPSHHGAWIRAGETAVLSASPEQFLHVSAGVVRTRPIKGTRPRFADRDRDAASARDLAASPKERAENVMIVDLMRNDLQRVCEPGSVAAERLLDVESYPAVHQLVSTVAGRLLPGTTLGDLLDATFPAGSMTGAPKLSAMTILAELEQAPRGVFAGCFGWVGDGGAADLAMTIRSIVVHPGGAYVGAGGGITWLSDAESEVDEVALKARGPLAALGAGLPAEWALRRRGW